MSITKVMHFLSRQLAILRRRSQPELFPAGHFYSPIANLDDIRDREQKIWGSGKQMPGIDWNEEAQRQLLLEAFPPYVAEIDFPTEKPADETLYFYKNDQFPVLDAEVLYCVLRHFRPQRVIEVGSGFSSLITAHVNRIHCGSAIRFSCVEPFPRQFLRNGVPGISELVEQRVEDVSLGFFEELAENDILFIDSSHVAKVGSDVNYLFFEVIPRLHKGALVHIHDIFLPDEYPRRWVIEEGRHWNEQYLVRAFLEFNQAFEIVWAAHFMAKFHHSAVRSVFRRFPALGGGGSLWIRRKV